MAALVGSALGIAGKLPGIPGVPTIPTAASAQSSGQSAIKAFLTKGFAIPWIALFVLAGGIPVAPFSFWGYGAVNLMAAGSVGWAAGKAAVQAMCLVANKFITAYYPSMWWLGWLIVLNPWYVFDLVQMFSPGFDEEGFKVPFLGTQIRPEDGVYKINGLIIGAMIALFSAGGYSLLQYLPPQVVGAAKPALELTFKVIGGAVALSGGGIGAALMLPQLLSSAKGDVAEIKKAVAVSGPAPAAAPKPSAPSAAPAATLVPPPLPSAPVAQKGGGGNPGSAFPTLREIADGLLGPSPRVDPAPYRSDILSGGGGGAKGPQLPDLGSTVFLGTLAVAALGGLSLALARSKGVSRAAAE